MRAPARGGPGEAGQEPATRATPRQGPDTARAGGRSVGEWRGRRLAGRLFDHADHLVEAIDFVGGADAEGGTLVDGVDLHVEDGAAGDAVGRGAAGFLDEEAKGRSLEGEAQLRGRGGGGGVGEDPLLLGELLVNVGDQAARVAKRVSLLHVVVDEVLVALEVLSGAHVRRGEDLAVRGNLDALPRADPVGDFLLLDRCAVGELVDAIVESDEDGSARPVEGDNRGDLVAAGRADEARGLVPDADHRADRPVVVDNRGAIKRIPADDVLAVGVALLDFGLFLRGSLVDDGRRPARFPHDLVRNHVDRELHVAESVRRAFDRHQRRPQRLRDLGARVQHLRDQRLQLGVRALLSQHLLQRRVALLLLRRRVEARVRRSKGVVGRRRPFLRR
mmetsp:Transcript_5355/g.16214  ORF Transcript_5355/g.16214 Transcript_5355/m.16214 type:complete len:390 (-) Transcript_5355:140-1309(-)